MRSAGDIELALAPRPATVTRQRWIYAEIRAAILAGRLAPGERLPPTREFARQLGVSRGTVLAVFEQLVAEGYLAGRVGSGTFVSAGLPSVRGQAAAVPADGTPPAGRLSERGALLATTPFPIAGREPQARPFHPNLPDLAAFPFALWNRIASRRSRTAERSLLADGEAGGYRPLREAIAERLRHSMRIACSAEQVMIVASFQQALDLCSRLVLDVGDAVWIEDPGYAGARRVLEASGARVVGVPVDRSGIDVEAGIRRAPRARLAYVTPSRQTPLGVTLAIERRLALLRWAQQADAVVVEDDYDGEYRYSGSPLAALKSLDVAARVVFAGSFSKLLFPSLRIAYAVVPPWLAEAFAAALSLTARHAPMLPQVVLHEFIAEGHFGRHIRRMRMLYGERAAALQHAAAVRLGGVLTVLPVKAGIDATALLPERADDLRIARRLATAGIDARPLSAYAIDAAAPSGLVLGFSAFTERQIVKAIARIAEVIESA